MGNEFTPRAAQQLLRKTNRQIVIVEIGSADGLDTRKFLDLMPSAQIVAIEPDPRHYESMKALTVNTSLNFLAVAVGRQDTTLPFYVSNTPYSSSLKLPTDALFDKWPEISFSEVAQVEVRSLDSILGSSELEWIDLVWADVQGAELDLIAGAKKSLSRTRYFYSEYSPERYYEDAPTLRELGKALGPNWKQMNTYQDNVLFRNIEICKPSAVRAGGI